MKLLLSFSIITLSACLVFSPAAHAEESDGIICAAVIPCDEQGNVISPFNSPSPCLQLYEDRCALNRKANELAEAVVQCEDKSESLTKEYEGKIRRLKAQVRRQRNRP